MGAFQKSVTKSGNSPKGGEENKCQKSESPQLNMKTILKRGGGADFQISPKFK